MTRVLGAAAAAVTMTLAAGCSGSDDEAGGGGEQAATPEKVTYLTGVSVQGRESYVYVAIEKGYFKDAGFEVEVKPGNGTNQNLQLLQSGQADFAIVDITASLIEYGKGTFKDFTVVSAIHQKNMACIIALAGNGIAAPPDLAGKKIAYIPGGVVKVLFDTYAKLAGVDGSKIQWVNIPAQQMAQNLAAGSIDAATQFVVATPGIEAAAQGKKPVVLPFSDFLPNLYGNGLAVSAKSAKDDPDRVRRFNEAVLKGLAYAIENPAEAGKIYAKHQKIQPEPVAAAEVTLMAPNVKSSTGPLGAVDTQRVTSNIAVIQEAGIIPTAFNPADVISFDLGPKS
jgi:NitT/TauT family transport system substrate-binding protein